MKKEKIQLSEFECKCGCGTNNVDPDFLAPLRLARNIAEIPFIINSGCRCKLHNSKVNGNENSSHLAENDNEECQCCAADIKATDDKTRYIIFNALQMAGFTRIGIRKDFIHVDNDLRKNAERLWVY